MFIFEKVICKKGTPQILTKTPGYYFRRLTKFDLSDKPFLWIIKNIFTHFNEKILLWASVIVMIISIVMLPNLMPYVNFEWNNVPRLTIFFLMGIVLAIIHELWLGTYIYQLGGENEVDFKLRFLWGVFLSIVVDWQYLLSQKRSEIIKIFLKVDIISGGFCGLLTIIGNIFKILGRVNFAYVFCTFSIIGYSYMLINLYPFFFKNDGYNLLCFATGTKRLRAYSFRMIAYKIMGKKVDFIEPSKKWIYSIWVVMFLLTLGFLVFAIEKGIRLRI